MEGKKRIHKWRAKHKHPCPVCGKMIDPRSKFCSKDAGKASRAENHYNWKGGRAISRGYVLVKMPNHPRADKHGYVREHFLVWENAKHKSITTGWIIHHINGIKSDNRLNNLVALPDKKHNHLIALKEKRIQELEALLNHQYQLV